MRHGSLSTSPPPPPLSLRATLAELRTSEGGLRALYRGNGANVFRLLPDTAFKFLFHDQFKMVFAPPEGSPLGIPEKLATGAAAGMARTLLFHPFDLARVRIATERAPAGAARTYGGIAGTLRATAQREGYRALYKGVGASLLSVVPYMAGSFAAFEELSQYIPDDKWSRAQLWHPVVTMGAGGLAAATAASVIYPVDTLRRRMQVR